MPIPLAFPAGRALVWFLVGGFLLAGCSADTAPLPPDTPPAPDTTTAVPTTTALKLPTGTFPRFLAFSGDGSLWITESSGNAIARLDPAEQLSHYRIPGFENSPGDIVKGPDDAMWFSGFEQVGRIDARGSITGWQLGTEQGAQVGLPTALTVGPDGAIWYTSQTVPPRITRVSSAGVFTSTEIPSGEGGLYLPGITAGPDGALWFTQAPVGPADPPDAIGRMTTEGQYTSWPLPRSRSHPTRITSGPDGTLWFTERSGSIGRIAVSGVISEFPLPAGVSPFDITSGTDGALWFTTDLSIGRITTSGQISLWLIAEAKGLIGIAAAADGTFWLADGQADTIWHFTPPGTLR